MGVVRPPGHRAAIAFAVACAGLAGCAPQERIGQAITEVNAAFQRDYERLLADSGTRTYPVSRAQAVTALHATLLKLGMRVTDIDPDLGTISAAAAAPRPLTATEWETESAKDLPRMRELAGRHVGLLAQLVRFEPEGLEIVIHATVLPAAGGVDIALTTRMREITPSRSGLPRREYPPPAAVAAALVKIWAGFEAELPSARRPG